MYQYVFHFITIPCHVLSTVIIQMWYNKPWSPCPARPPTWAGEVLKRPCASWRQLHKVWVSSKRRAPPKLFLLSNKYASNNHNNLISKQRFACSSAYWKYFSIEMWSKLERFLRKYRILIHPPTSTEFSSKPLDVVSISGTQLQHHAFSTRDFYWVLTNFILVEKAWVKNFRRNNMKAISEKGMAKLL